MKTLAFAVPGDLATPTGGYAYDRRIVTELAGLGWNVDVIDLGEGFPRASAETRASARRRLGAVPQEQRIVIDGLAFGVLPEATELRASHKLIALVHHPLANETGLQAAEAQALRESERRALAGVHRVIATSAFTARLLVNEYGVPDQRINVVRPGTDRVSLKQPPEGKSVSLLAVGAVVPRKGYDVLLAALAKLTKLPWHLTIAGDRGRDLEAGARLYSDIVRYALVDRVTLAGAVSAEDLEALYHAADLFVLASHFEGYGMAFAEAIAHGLPVVGTMAGAIPETVPLGAGVLVPPDNPSALSEVLRRLIENREERQRLAEGARKAATGLPTWRASAEQFARAVETAA